MASKLVMGLAVVLAFVIGMIAIGQMDGLQDTAEANTTGVMNSLFATVTPITVILFAGAVGVVFLMGATSSWGSHR